MVLVVEGCQTQKNQKVPPEVLDRFVGSWHWRSFLVELLLSALNVSKLKEKE